MAQAGSRTMDVTFPNDTEILITRTVNAPPHLVYRAWTTPELVRRWWPGPRGQMTVADVDFRVGGAWRYAMVAHGEFEPADDGGATIVRICTDAGTREVRDMIAQSGMEGGVREQFELIEELAASLT